MQPTRLATTRRGQGASRRPFHPPRRRPDLVDGDGDECDPHEGEADEAVGRHRLVVDEPAEQQVDRGHEVLQGAEQRERDALGGDREQQQRDGRDDTGERR